MLYKTRGMVVGWEENLGPLYDQQHSEQLSHLSSSSGFWIPHEKNKNKNTQTKTSSPFYVSWERN